MPTLALLVGPPGSGKSTHAVSLAKDMGYSRISQDDQGKEGHFTAFKAAIAAGWDVIVDRMNFDTHQRKRYIEIARAAGYTVKITIFHQPKQVCYERCLARQDHPTIKDSSSAGSALNTFFSKYEKPTTQEADEIAHVWPEGDRPYAVICDLDGTLCNVEHRRHHVRGEGKKNWKAFFDEIPNDKPNEWCIRILEAMDNNHAIIFCSGRGDNQRKTTIEWLSKHLCDRVQYDHLFMRGRNDQRQDSIVKEIILDFEILTRFTPLFAIDDRQQVVDMWRSRGVVCLQCEKGDF